MRYSINLIKPKTVHHSYDKTMVFISIFVLIICFSLNFIKLSELKKDEVAIANEIKKFDNPKPIGLNISAIEAEIQATNRLLNIHQFDWSKFLSILEKVIPEKMSIENIMPTFEKETVYISGFCATEQELVQLLKNLQASGWASEIYLAEQRVVEGSKEPALSFSISFKYKGSI